MKRRIPFALPVIVVFLALVLPRGPGAIAQSATPALAPAADSTSVAEPAPAPTSTSAASAVAASDSTSAIKVAERDAERAERLAIRDNGLAMLYKTQPEVQKAVEAAAGYAVLDVTAVYIILFVGQSGKGVLVDNASKKVTYMSSKRVGTFCLVEWAATLVWRRPWGAIRCYVPSTRTSTFTRLQSRALRYRPAGVAPSIVLIKTSSKTGSGERLGSSEVATAACRRRRRARLFSQINEHLVGNGAADWLKLQLLFSISTATLRAKNIRRIDRLMH